MKVLDMRLIFWALLPLARASEVKIYELKDQTLVPGIHLEEANEIVYDTFIPLIYEVPLPSWTPTDLSVPNYLSDYFKNCTNDNFYESWGKFQCPVSFHMKDVIQRISEEYQVFNKYSNSNYTYGAFVEDISCSKLMQHFKDTPVLSKEDWNQYVSNLRDCKHAKVFFENVTTLSVNSTIYGTMLKNFINVYSSSKTYYSNYQRMAAYTNAYGIFQTAQLVEYSLMKSEWKEAVSTCKSGVFPTTLIPKAKLQSHIKDIQSFLSSANKGDKLSIEDVSEMTDYISLPLTDCTMLEDSTLIVRIQIPTRRETSSLGSTFKIKTIPFLRKLNTSDDMEILEICEFKESLGDLRRLRLVSENNIDYSQASCHSHYPLCEVKSSIENQCLLNILLNNIEYITEECPMTCKAVNKTSELPYFRRISSDTWIILEERTNKDVFVSCDSKPMKMISGLESAGTLQVTLPCDCQLMHRGRSLNSSMPCGQSLIVKEIKPHFFNKTLIEEEINNEAGTKQNNSGLNSTVAIALSAFAVVLSCISITIGFAVLKKMISMEELLKLK